MKKTHPKYKIKQEDNLQTISKLFDFDQDIWVRYHNTMCRLDEIIRKDIPENLTEIYLLPDLWDKENELNNTITIVDEIKILQKSPLGYLNTLPYRNRNAEIKYGVNIEIETNINLEPQFTQIDFEVSLRWHTDKEYHIVEINKISPTYINKQLPDLMMDQLASETCYILYPIQFRLDEKVQITSLHNLQDIKIRWEQGKQKLRQQWKGDWVEKYFKLIDKSLLSSFTFLKKIKKDWFLYTYFFDIRKTYTENYEITTDLIYPFSPKFNQGLKYTIKQQIEEYLNEHNRIQVNINGDYDDEITANYLSLKLSNKILKTETKPSGTYFAKYYIDPRDYTIDSCITKCVLKLETEKIITVSISRFT